jgi:hypothetical protein
MPRPLRFTVLSLSDPDGPPTGGTLRVGSLADALERAGHQVSRLFPATGATAAVSGASGVSSSLGEGRIPGPLRRLKRHLLPMPTRVGASNANLADAVAASAPDVLVVTALSQVGYRTHVPHAQLWMDFLDLWSSFARNEQRNRRGPARWTTGLQARQLSRLEIRTARAADVATAVGWADAAALAVHGIQVTWLPTTLPEASFREAPQRRPHVLGMLANFHFWPNRDAYERFAQDWAPLARARGWSCVVAGLGSLDLPAYDGVTLLGPVTTVREFYDQVGATAAPLALGGGMKVKVVESLAHGVPVLASAHAVEGLPPDLARLVQVTDLSRPELDRLEAEIDGAALAKALMPFRVAHLDDQVREISERLVRRAQLGRHP